MSEAGTERAPQAAELPPEARTGLAAFKKGELPKPPTPKGLQWIGVVGPGVIVLGAAIGSGEYLLGPALFVKYGFVLMWVMGLSILFQTLFNQEVMRYTLYTGEPVMSGFMRTKPRASFWAWVYGILWFLQQGWPGWASAAAGAVFFLFAGEVAGDADANTLYLIAMAAYALCILIVLVGRRIERTLEVLNWVLVVAILGGFLVIVLVFTSPSTWGQTAAGYVGYDTVTHTFNPIPAGIDFFLLGAVAAYAGAGGFTNIVLSNWGRDKGYGMGSVSGYIPAAIGGQRIELSHTGTVFDPNEENLSRWKGWWRITRADQWWVFFVGAMLGIILPAIIYVEFIPRGQDLESLGVAAALSDVLTQQVNAALGFIVGIFAVWILFKTQLDILEGFVRGLTDMVWSSSERVRSASRGDVRRVYYVLFGLIVLFGLLALRIPAPLVLLSLGANWAGVVMVVSSLHLLRINTKLLPKEVQPSSFRKFMLVAMAIFYAVFVWLFLFGGLVPNPDSDSAFLFNLTKYFSLD
jgi:hypothetical protein